MTANAVPAAPAKELILTRTFDAPRSVVFKAWTDPEALARWWGPHGFTNPVCQVDPRPEGRIHIDMKGPDGTIYPMPGVFREVVEPERIAFTAWAHLDESGDPAFEVLNTITFAEDDGKTTLTLRAVVVKAKPEAAPALAGMEAGWSGSLDRLEAEVVAIPAVDPSARPFVITRVFNAPRSRVFAAWTEAEHLQHWFGPKGFTFVSGILDLRRGGVYHYGMKAPNGQTMWGRWIFREVTPPERLVFVASFSTPFFGMSRHPFAPEWPLEVLSMLTFTEDKGRTTVSMSGVPINATAAERAVFEAGHDSMQQGWTGTLDQLTEYLARA